MTIHNHRSLLYVPVFVAAVLCLGCSSKVASKKQGTASEEAGSETQLANRVDRPKQLGEVGTLSGTVVFEGDSIPEGTMIPIGTDAEYCGHYGTDGAYPAENFLIDSESRGIRNVIVYLMGNALRNWPDTPREDIVIDNRNCRFEPHVAVSTVGSVVQVKNSDEVFHTTNLYGMGFPFQFNPALPIKGATERTALTRPGVYFVKCDKHGWMKAFLRVDTHPFHATTDQMGRFEITGIPPGTYQLGLFHEELRPETRDPEAIEVTIQADEETSLNLKLSI